ncbi:hypothetical protein J3F83DRAFT_747691 [Trichoderma novae-zelandiae]
MVINTSDISPFIIMSNGTMEARLPRHEMLHQLRGLEEGLHRDLVHNRSTDPRWIFQPSVSDMASLAAEMTLEDADDCCNKATGIYVYSTKRTIYICLLLQTLHNYLYEKWFRPYKSEIEYVRFIAKTFLPELMPEDLRPGPLASLAVSVHAAICKRAQEARDAVKNLSLQSRRDCWDPPPPNCPKTLGRGAYATMHLGRIIRHQEFFLLRPLFRALIIIIRLEEYRDKDMDIAQLPVLLIRTGVEDGLSAPISFEPIGHQIQSVVRDTAQGKTAVRVALEVAVDFVLSLEKREIDAFGHQPDPIVSTRDLEDGGLADRSGILERARQLGWGDEPLAGPSSAWVDTKIHTGWCGGGVYSANRTLRAQRFERGNVTRCEKTQPYDFLDTGGSRKHWNVF